MATRTRKRKSRRPTSRLARQSTIRPIRQPIQQNRARIISDLADAIGACEDLFAEHGADCECETCSLVSNLVGAVRVFHMLLQIT